MILPLSSDKFTFALIPRFLSSQSVRMDMGTALHHSLLKLDPDDPPTEIKIIEVNAMRNS